MCNSDFLFARPSFIEGMASVVDIGGTLQVYNDSNFPEEADARAIFNDFLVVGNDLRTAINHYSKESVKT